MSRKRILTVVGASVLSAGVSSGITWIVANRLIAKAYDERLQDEVAQSLRHILKNLENLPAQVIVSDEDPDELVDQLNNEELPFDVVTAEVDEEIESSDIEVVAEESEEIQGERVFGSESDKPPLSDLGKNNKVQYDKIVTVQEPEEIFPAQPDLPEPPPENPDISVISRDLFIENPTEWDQTTLTYFQDGGVLDINMEFVEGHEDMIGAGVPRFGELSEDENVVYVRNKKLEKEFEVIRDPGESKEFLIHSLGEMYKPEHLR